MENLPKMSQIGTQPLKGGLRKFELSDEVVVGPLSFYDPASLKEKGELKHKEKPIVPCYIPLQVLNRPRNIHPNTIFQDFSIEKDGDLKLTNKDLLKRQKGILAFVIRKAAGKIFEGKGIVGLSLPVRIFEPRSTIERICDMMSFAPHFLARAAAAGEGVERMKNVFLYTLSILPLTIGQWKPFNPLLGETYQGELIDGTVINCEHTSHHPPITNFYNVNQNWKMYGALCYNGNLKGNHFNAYNEGWSTIEFNDGHKLKFYIPSMSLKNMLLGTRKCQFVSSLCVKDEKNKLKAAVKMNVDARSAIVSIFKSSKQDTFKGAVYTYSEKEDRKIQAHKKWYDMMRAQGEMTDVVKVIEKIEGSWIGQCKMNKKVVWSLGDILQVATPPTYRADCLPSDCRFREDLTWLFYKNEDQSQIWKTLLEEQQRKDRKLRKQFKEAA